MPLTRRHFTPPSLRLSTFLRANRFFLIGLVLLILVNFYLVLTRQQGEALIAINQLRTPFFDTVFINGTRLGEPIAYLVVVVVMLTFRLRTALFTVITGILAGGLTGLLKVYFAEARPMRFFFENAEDTWYSLNLFDDTMRNWGDTSFPSGHTAAAFALYSFICFNVRRPKILISILCFLLAIEVGFSRMYLLFHFLRDVTAGAALGLLVAVAMFFAQWHVFRSNRLLNDGIWWRRATDTPE